ncbi:DUF4430 domain-containing protein [Fodinisporobacter ferrooxydans]|uniref:DUF4430 domain-containing protein n=1 Tax=Fodinisporobacter ferrooxydans TaxID=2901836 RepID=A0ABY4CQP6_9BACL|nr:DUF4430 domain-containing protein [Alicyclobacillaceae bacterium MYW30-H2]
MNKRQIFQLFMCIFTGFALVACGQGSGQIKEADHTFTASQTAGTAKQAGTSSDQHASANGTNADNGKTTSASGGNSQTGAENGANGSKPGAGRDSAAQNSSISSTGDSNAGAKSSAPGNQASSPKTTASMTIQPETTAAGTIASAQTAASANAMAASSASAAEKSQTVSLMIVGDRQLGVILPRQSAAIQQGDTVLDVLSRVLKEKHMQMEYSGMGSSAYIKGIDNLYEFDDGPKSGWMFKVNGAFGQQSAGSYPVKAGDSIEWLYTIDLGKDIGAK